jgi:hypothetical protein
MPKALKYAFGAIALYLLVANASGTSSLLGGAATGTEGIVGAFQGRSTSSKSK